MLSSIRPSLLAAFATALFLALPVCSAHAQVAGAYKVTNLVSDGSVPATVMDSSFVNPWAMSVSGTWWISTANTGFNYVVSSSTFGVSFKVVVPPASGTGTGFPAGSVTTTGATGVVLPNGTKASFLFATLDGTISGWNSKLGTAGAVCQIVINNSSAGASYPGLALLNTATASYLLVPNFGTGNKVEVYDGNFQPTKLSGNFTDPNLPSGYAPFSIHILNNQIFVAYALRTATAPYRTVDAVGNGVVDVFDLNGNFVSRVATGGQLDSPWGVAIAPSKFGPFGGAILIGNFGNGLINAYDPKTYAYLGQLADSSGKPLTYASLWELLPGGTAITNSTSVSGGDTSTVYFTAGLANETHGLLGAIANDTSAGTATYAISVANPNLTVADGGSATTFVSLAPVYGFTGATTLSCSGLPTGAICNFGAPVLTSNGTAPAVTSLSIQTTKKMAATRTPSRPGLATIAVALLLPFGTFLGFRRRMFKPGIFVLLVCGALGSVQLISGCGDGGTAAFTPTGTSQVTVTATSGSVAQSTSIGLVVQ